MQRHIRFAIYELTQGSFQEVAGLAKDGMLPRFSTEPGFIEYGVADIGNRKVCSITIWETREQAEKSVNVASTWVKENLSNRVKLVTSYVGELAFLHGAPVLA
jgi:heme-degrading monooxygenase HmoA